MTKIQCIIKLYCNLLSSYSSSIIPTDEEGYFNVRVQFLNEKLHEDETEFDIKPSHFDYVVGKCRDLEELWRDFCKENHFKQNAVTGLYIVGGPR